MMRIHNYFKYQQEESVISKFGANMGAYLLAFFRTFKHKRMILLLACLLIIPLIIKAVCYTDVQPVSLNDGNVLRFSSAQANTAGKRSVITIPSGVVKANPFVPYRELTHSVPVTDVPAFDLVEPPEVVNSNSDAARVMDTIVSGILYDKYSPSAILNIEGNDYLVKKGDIINNYKVINIVKDSVTVKLGSNVYTAGIGEILTEGELNRNDVANLNNKFGGLRNELR